MRALEYIKKFMAPLGSHSQKVTKLAEEVEMPAEDREILLKIEASSTFVFPSCLCSVSLSAGLSMNESILALCISTLACDLS